MYPSQMKMGVLLFGRVCRRLLFKISEHAKSNYVLQYTGKIQRSFGLLGKTRPAEMSLREDTEIKEKPETGGEKSQ